MSKDEKGAADAQELQTPAPHVARAAAWIVDYLIILLLVRNIPGEQTLLLLPILLVAYHTVLVWLAQQTIGKAIFGLKVIRGRGKAGFFWSLGRAGIGYPLLTVLGLGLLIALFDRSHRSLHDRVFGSVVCFKGKPGAAAALDRVKGFAQSRKKAYEKKTKTLTLMSGLWSFLESLTGAVNAIILKVATVGGSASAIGQAVATSAGMSLTQAAATTVVAGAITTGAVAVAPEPAKNTLEVLATGQKKKTEEKVPEQPSGEGTAQLKTPDWIPAVDWWGVRLPGKVETFKYHYGTKELALPPGTYDAIWNIEHASADHRIAAISIEHGEVTDVSPQAGGLRLRRPDWLPNLVSWEVRLPGKPDWLDYVGGARFMLVLPPGAYDVYWKVDETNVKHRIAAAVDVRDGEVTAITPRAGGLRIKSAPEWLPRLDSWEARPSGKSDWLDYVGRARSMLVLPPGTYDVYWKVNETNAKQRVADSVVVKDGEINGFTPRAGGLRLSAPEWLPKLSSWSVRLPGKSKRLDYVSRARSMLVLPPGTYNAYWKTGKADTAHRIAANVQVTDGELIEITPEAGGLRLKTRDWLPELDWWGVRRPRATESFDKVPSATSMLVLPPGEYDVYWDVEEASTAHRIAAAVKVGSGEVTEIAPPAGGLRLRAPEWLPKLDSWSVRVAGQAERVDSASRVTSMLVLVPGQYDIYWDVDLPETTHLVATAVTVTDGDVTEITPQAGGLRLRVPDWLPKLDSWSVRRAGEANKLDSVSSVKSMLVLPPETYDVYWDVDRPNTTHLISEPSVTVKDGELTEITPNAGGLRLTGAAGQNLRWWGVRPVGQEARYDWVSSHKDVLVLPPGEYDVIWHSRSESGVSVVKRGVQIEAGKLLDVAAR